MSIPIGRGRRSRRSYADYKPPSRKTGRHVDPFLVVFFLVVAAAVIWGWRNPNQIKALVASFIPQNINVPVVSGPTTPTPEPGQFAVQAEQAYQEGRLADAIELYRQASGSAPNNVGYAFQVARLLLFQSAMQYGDKQKDTLDEALAAADKTILANPERPEGYAIRGKVMDWQSRPDEAASQISRAMDFDKNYALGHSFMAEVLVDQTRWDQAQESIDKALAIDPNNVDIRRDYGYVLEMMGDYAGAATQYETAVQLHPKLSYLRMALGRAYRTNGRHQEALDQFFAVATVEPSNALVPFEMGRTYETYIGDPNAALEQYEHAVELDEDYASPWIRIGTLRYIQGSYVQAIPAFERALALGVESVDVYYQLGLSYANEGQCSDAITYLQKAQDLAEGDERILDAIQTGYEVCEQTPTAPLTPTATKSP